MFVLYTKIRSVSLKKNLLYNFLLSVSQVAFPLISIPYVSRVLPVEGIGKVSFVDSLTYYFIVVAEFGIVAYAIREISRKRNDKKELSETVSELLSLHVFTSLAAIFLYLISVFFLYEKIGDLRLILFSFSFLLVNSFACEWYFWGTEQFKYITIRSLITRLLGLASIFILIRRGDDYVWYYAIIAGSAILNLSWNSIKMFLEVPVKLSKPNFKKHFSFLKITYQISLLYSVILMLDNVFLQLVGTSVAVAFYTYSVKIVRIASAVVTDTLLVFYPRTVSLVHEKNEHGVEKTIMNASDIIFLFTIPVAAGIFLMADKLAILYFGKAFQSIALNLRILAFFPLIKAYSLFLNKQLLMPYDKEKLVLKGLWIGVLVFLVTTFPLSYYYADRGTSIAIMVSEIATFICYLVWIPKPAGKISFFNARMLTDTVLASLLFIPVVYFTENSFENNIVTFVFQIFTCVAVYFVFLFIAKNKMFLLMIDSLKTDLINIEK